ncbi:MAG: glutamate 5-kinase [bacterium]
MHASPKNILNRSKRIIIKIGSSLLIDHQNKIDHKWLQTIVAEIAAQKDAGSDIIIVSSGAVAIGRKRLGLQGSLKLEEKQATAAAGQAQLIEAWEQALSAHNLISAQLLLTLDITSDRRSYLNARATLETLLPYNVIPIINENDTVATAELRYGDNDRLAAHTAQMSGADLLILLSDVDGLYTDNPVQNSAAVHIPYIKDITPEIEAYAHNTRSSTGTGGMITKLAAAKIAAAAGCATLITSGYCKKDQGPLQRLVTGAKATFIRAAQTPMAARKNWIAQGLSIKGSIAIDDGAQAALNKGASLLPAGIVAVTGMFQRGDLVSITDHRQEIARGIVRYTSQEIKNIAGKHSDQIADILGYIRRPEIIHRDDLVLQEFGND